MGDESTWREDDAAEAELAVVLVASLFYDDLLAPAARWFELEAGATLESGRGKAGLGPGAHAEGRGRIDLGDRRASQLHARIGHRGSDRLGPIAIVEDGGSKNGSFVNGASLVGKKRLVDGDVLEVGRTLFVARVVPRRLVGFMGADGGGVQFGPTETWCPELAALAVDLARIGPSTEPVLVLGETGTGKEVVARAIHAASRRSGPLVSVDCGAIPDSLFESTLFGHKKGAFTGASEPRVGDIARAHRGTLFLDEVANTSVASQAKLLRVLEDAAVTPLGGSEATQVDVRYVAATNAAIASDGTGFRRDLLARLAGFVGTLPPLRKRREDLGALASHVLREAGAERASITVAAARRLFLSPLGGNVRELRAVLRSASLLSAGEPIDLPHLAVASSDAPAAPAPGDAPASDGPIDAAALESALRASSGNVVRAATRLGIHPRQLYRFAARFGVDLEAFRRS